MIEQKYINLIIFSLFFFILIKLNTREDMSQMAYFKDVIEKNYKIDVDAIRNLSKLANDLTKNNSLIIPGGLYVKGGLQVDGTIGIATTPQDNIGINIKGDNLDSCIKTEGALGLESTHGVKLNGEAVMNGGIRGNKVRNVSTLNINSNLKLNGTMGIMTSNHPRVGIKVKNGLTQISYA